MLNKCAFIGNLGADPEIKSFANGGRIANLRLAVTERWKAKDGERKERTEWISIVINSEGLVGVAERFLRKGSKVYVEGQLRTRKWQDQSGNDRYTTEVSIGGIGGVLTMLDSAKGSEGRSGSTSSADHGRDRGGSGASGSQSGFSGGFGDDLDDEIPF